MDRLAQLIARGMSSDISRDELSKQTRETLDGLFGSRYQVRSPRSSRIALMPSDDSVSFAGLVHEDSPTSGVYGGMSLIWFPADADSDETTGSLLTFVCGTRGLAPDEQILGRPGHSRHLQALRRYLSDTTGVPMWAKHDPTNLSEPFPQVLREEYRKYTHAITRYGNYIYACVSVPKELERARTVVSAFLDFYAWERGWQPLSAARSEVNLFKGQLRANLFPKIDRKSLVGLLRERRFVILQGPPGRPVLPKMSLQQTSAAKG